MSVNKFQQSMDTERNLKCLLAEIFIRWNGTRKVVSDVEYSSIWYLSAHFRRGRRDRDVITAPLTLQGTHTSRSTRSDAYCSAA